MDLWREIDKTAYTATDLPRYPARTLLTHVLWKGVQVGSVAGVILSPIYGIARAQPLTQVYSKVLWRTTALGAAASLAALAYREYDGVLSVEGVDDRAYRISKNLPQSTMDSMSLVGLAAGATAGAIFGTHGHRSVITGGLTGVVGALALYGLEYSSAPGGAIAALQQPSQTTTAAMR